jgi:hypothetical protein
VLFNKIKFLFFLSLILQVSLSNSQYVWQCIGNQYPLLSEFASLQTANLNLPLGGNYKPERTDIYPGTNDTTVFPVLIVFVKFPSGEPFPQDPNWPANGDPVFLNNVIANYRNSNYGAEWWNAYSEENARLSDFWMEASRGHFHIAGKVFSLTLPMSAAGYRALYGSRGIEKINDDIYNLLNQLLNPQQWQFFDQWKKENGLFVNASDNYVDMIYKVHRSWADSIGMPAGGAAVLYQSYQYGEEYPVPNTSLKINGTFSEKGSGITITPGSGAPPIDLRGTVSFTSHEHGHYLFGDNHVMYGKMSGTGAGFGVDECLSPWESIKLGYMTPKVVDYGSTNHLYQIGDFSSRNSSLLGEVLKVPVSIDEYFLIACRTKVSSYDKIMWGDTARGIPYRTINPDYGKGLYIYHTPSGYNWPPLMDQECADGLWNYAQDSWDHPDWDPQILLPVFRILQPAFYKNDKSDYDDFHNPGSNGLNARDGKSVNKAFFAAGNPYYEISYFGIGKKEIPSGSGNEGTDRVFSNEKETWTSREFLGDRWDGWNIGYNQVFSPYSCPSTAGWLNDANTGIFIYYQSQTEETANIKVYRVNPLMPLDTILFLTPPSKPMIGYKIDTAGCINAFGHPKISWVNSKEPDMLRGEGFRRYKIFRAYSNSPSELPVNYEQIDTYDSYMLNEISSYTDTAAIINSSSLFHQETGYLRYKIAAVDKYDSVSVLSDFSSIQGSVSTIGVNNHSIPLKFSIANYPNPFNPVAIIKYSIPRSIHVTIKIFNIIGQELLSLVNENKTAGEYTVKFDGTNYSSGVYFCRIEAGDQSRGSGFAFTETKKMLLIK